MTSRPPCIEGLGACRRLANIPSQARACQTATLPDLALCICFEFRLSDLFRISCFEFRICSASCFEFRICSASTRSASPAACSPTSARGRLELIDGNLRRDLDPDMELDVEVLDVNDAEARALLLSIDPLAALAETQQQLHDRLLDLTPTPLGR